MILYFDHLNGRITRATSDNQPLYRDHDVIKVQGVIDPGSHYVALPTATLAARPRLALPHFEVGLGTDWTIADAPPGTEIRLDGILVGVTESQGPLSISFPAAATYALTISPPWPWLEAEITVTVNAP